MACYRNHSMLSHGGSRLFWDCRPAQEAPPEATFCPLFSVQSACHRWWTSRTAVVAGGAGELLPLICLNRYNSTDCFGRYDGGGGDKRGPVVPTERTASIVPCLPVWFCLVVIGLFCSDVSSLAADVIRLKNGGEIRGLLLTPVTRTPGEIIAIRTLRGSRIEVSGDLVVLVARRPVKVEEYESRAARVFSDDDTVDGHWALAEWCRGQRLSQQRRTHLERVVALDPQHRPAHYGLGHALRDGRWMSRDEYMRSRGLVRFRGRYVTPQQKEDLLLESVQREAYRKWFSRIRTWHGWLQAAGGGQQARGHQALAAIKDPVAVVALVKILGPDKNSRVRILLAEVLGRIPGPGPVEPLVSLVLRDGSYEVRTVARRAISEDHTAIALPIAVRGLSDPSNIVVRRSAGLLADLGDIKAVPPLIEALVTRHLYRVRVPGSKHPSFAVARNGTPVHPAIAQGFGVPPQVIHGMQMGQFPFGVVILPPQFAEKETHVVSVVVDHQNTDVLAALKRLTKEELGFNKRSWRVWWLAFTQGAT